jgi:hypothetical protein
MLSKISERLGPRSRAALPWVCTAGLVACAFLIRLPMQSVLSGGLAYSAFYPAVILATYAFGRSPGIVAAAASAVLGYWIFVEPAFDWNPVLHHHLHRDHHPDHRPDGRAEGGLP